jgi:hypothetical protein
MAATDPELDVGATAMLAAGAEFVLVGGFAVIANRFVRATEDIDFLVPDDPDNDRRVLSALCDLDALRYRDDAPLDDEHLLGQAHLRMKTRAGVIESFVVAFHPWITRQSASARPSPTTERSSSTSPACAASSVSSVSPIAPGIAMI